MRPNVLMLQGPVGPFFARFAKDLEKRGFNVFKINFNGGDELFYRRRRSIRYQGKLKDWDQYLERLLLNNDIGRIYLFGDCRSYHRVAREVAERLDVKVFVFEEGYIRPDFITLEEKGVNGNSPMMSKELELEEVLPKSSDDIIHPERVFMRTALFSIAYYLAAALKKSRFRYYQHHRSFSPVLEGSRWIVSAIRKWRYQRREQHVLSELMPQFEDNYFLCPLQVHCDMQVSAHSDFNSIEHFIGDVVASFVKHAPENKALVFKHHPLDRGYTDYTVLFENLASEYGLRGRLFYVHDVCLPTLLKNAQGTILINSTVGMSSLFHSTPVITLGRAIYDLQGLTYQKDLNEFWTDSGNVDQDLFERFRQYLINNNQLNGSLYRRFSGVANSAGLIWSSSRLIEEHSYREERPDLAGSPQLKLVGGRDVEEVHGPYTEEELQAMWDKSKSA